MKPLALTVSLLVFTIPLSAEMVVKTKDGRTFKVAVEGSEVSSIEFHSSLPVKPSTVPTTTVAPTTIAPTTALIDGLWDTTIPGTVHVQLEFTRTGNGWSGRFFGRNGWEKMADLVVDPAKGTISWRRPLAWAGETDQTYTAHVSGNLMIGAFNGSSSWTGNRASK